MKWLPEDIHEALNLLQDRIGYTDSEHEAYQHIDAIRRILEKEERLCNDCESRLDS